MALNSAVAFLLRILSDPQFRTSMITANSLGGRMAAARAEGYEFDYEELEAVHLRLAASEKSASRRILLHFMPYAGAKAQNGRKIFRSFDERCPGYSCTDWRCGGVCPWLD